MSSWSCEYCTFDNSSTLSLCEVCGNKREKSLQEPEDNEEKGWQCKQCTLFNNVSDDICSTCGNEKESNESECRDDNVEIEYVWEWNGGTKWNEYPQSISDKIESAYNGDGTLRFDFELSYGEYTVDLTRLVQINKATKKQRRLQRVKYEYTPSERKQTAESGRNDDGISDKMEVDDDDASDNDKNIKIMNNDNKQMKNTKKHKKPNGVLSALDDEHNQHIPAPVTLSKKRKRKFSDIVSNADENESKTQPQKKQKLNDSSPIKISTKYSAKHNDGNLNDALISALRELSNIERNTGNRHKANAYSKACKSLREYDKKISSGKEAQKLPGIGAKIAKKIDELLQTGHLKKLDELRADDTIRAINELCTLHGIGSVKASDLVRTHKICSIEALRQRTDLLNHAQKIGLKYYDFIQQRIPRAQVGKIGDIIKRTLGEMDDEIIANVCGSYRRGSKDCGDVDILISHPNKKYDQREHSKQLLSDIVEKFRVCQSGLEFVENLALGPLKYMGICRYEEKKNERGLSKHQVIPKDFKMFVPSFDDDDLIHLDDPQNDKNHNDNAEDNDDSDGQSVFFRRIDLKFINFNSYYASLLHFTGPDSFNRNMRMEANAKMMILSENGLYQMLDPDDHSKKGDIVLHPKSEKEIFDAIGIDFVEPCDRK